MVIESEVSDDQQKRLRTPIANIPGAIYSSACDANRTVEVISDAIAEISGYPASDFINNPVRALNSIIHPADREMVEKIVGESVNENKPYSIEYRIVRADGSMRWVYETGQEYFLPLGNSPGLYRVILDITECKQVEEVLEASQAKNQAFLNAIPDLLLLIGKDGTLLEYKPGKENILPQLPKSVGQNFYEILPSEIAIVFRDAVEQSLSTGELQTCEFQLSINGGLCYYEARIVVSGDKKVLAIIRDITQRNQTESALQKNLELIYAIADALPAYIGYVDRELRYRFVNKRYEDWFKLSQAEIIGKHVEELLGSSVCQRIKGYIQAVFSGEEVTYDDIRISEDGVTQYQQITYVPQFGEQKEVLGFFVLVQDITESKRSAQVLQESEARYRELAESISDVFFAIDKKFKYIYWNKASEKLTGIAAKDAIGKSLYELFPEVRGTTAEQTYLEAFKTKQPQHCVIDYQLGEQEYFFEINAYPSAQESLSVFVRDITARKQAEEALRKSEQKLSLHVEQTPLAIIESNIKGEIVEWNLAAEAIFGYSKNEIIGRSFSVLVPESARERVAKLWKKLWRQKGGTRSTNENTTQDGRIIICEWYNTPLIDRDGNFIGIISLAQDITERVKTEEALRQSEERFRQMAENSNEVFWIATADLSQILYISPAYEKIWGRTCSSLYEQPMSWLDAIHPDDRDSVATKINQCLTTESYQQRYEEFRIIRPEGSVCWIADRCFPIRNELGQVYRLAGIAQDISDRKRAEAALRHQTEQEKLVATITQRIRQSLNLNEILHTAVTEVRQLLNCDRVLIYRIWPEGTGNVISEAVVSDWPAILGHAFPEEVFPHECYERYQSGEVRAIANLEHDMLPCLTEVLGEFGVKAKLVAPLNQGEVLWGLLIAHQCSSIRQWQPFEISLLKQLSTQLAIAIQQASLFEKLEAANQELRRLACLDGLTQVANRRYFDEYLDREWQRLAREQLPLALILCDIDYFKQYNDTYGHVAGDICLQKIANAIGQAVKRPADLVARYGGEEFAVILPNTKAEGAFSVAEEIQKTIKALNIGHANSQVSHYVTVSLGVTVIVPTPRTSPNRLIDTADQALYAAKFQGRDRAILKICR